jgi:hypothetical protein
MQQQQSLAVQQQPLIVQQQQSLAVQLQQSLATQQQPPHVLQKLSAIVQAQVPTQQVSKATKRKISSTEYNQPITLFKGMNLSEQLPAVLKQTTAKKIKSKI